jgi:hypothetical protein
MKRLLITTLCTAVTFLSGPANATVWSFDITGNGSASFVIDSSKNKPWSVNNTGITYANVAGIYNGTSTSRYVQFFNDTGYGGFNTGFVGQGKGTMLYTGSTADPVFTIGTFSLLPFAFGASGGYTVTIKEMITAAVPEPATWTMMLVGFGMVSGAARYRRRKSTTVYA